MRRVGFAVLGVAVLLSWGATGANADMRLRDVVTIESDRTLVAQLSLRVDLDAATTGRWESLRATPTRFSTGYRDALANLLTAGHTFSSTEAEEIVDAMRGLPEVKVADGTATLTVNSYAWPLWEESRDRTVLSMYPRLVQPGTHLIVGLESGGGELLSAWPLPDRDDGEGTLLWRFDPGETTGLRIRLHEPIVFFDRSQSAKGGLSFLVGGLPFALLMLILSPWRASGPLPRRTLSRLGLAGLALSLFCVAYYVVEYVGYPTGGPDLARVLLPGLGTGVFVALAFSRWRLALGLMVLLTGALGLLITHRSALEVMGNSLTHAERSTAESALSLLLIAAELAAVLAATGNWLRSLIPRLSGLRGRWVLWPAVFGAAVFAAEIALSVGSQTFLDNFSNGEPGFSALLGYFLDFVTFITANLARNISLVLLEIGLSGWLWKRSLIGEVPFIEWRENAIFALLVGTAVIGLGGAVDGYEVPLGFLIAVPALTVAIHWLTSRAEATALTRFSVRAETKDLLQRSVKLAMLRQQKRALHGELIEGKRYESEIAALDGRREALLDSPALEGIPADRRGGAALALGLAGKAGARERWRHLGRLRWAILVGPMAYTVFSLLDNELARAVSVNQPLGLAFLLTGLLQQALMWPIAAWCFIVLIPILPGRVGPAKGVLAGVFCAIPPGIASLIIDDVPGTGQWLFIPAELTLLFVAIGFVLDYRRLREVKGDLRQLGELYSITNVRAAVTYLAPLALLLFSVVHGLATGRGSSAVEGLFTNANSLFPH